MRIAISGASGLIGAALTSLFRKTGHEVLALARQRSQACEGAILWDPEGRHTDAARLEGLDAVIHLAGENIAAGRWNDARKARLRDSRVVGTRTLCRTLAALTSPPRAVLCASAIGFYGDRGEKCVDERSDAGTGFLAGVCQEWEASTRAAAEAGARVIHMRFGMVLSAQGGALPRMLTPFRLGLGGTVGRGRQYVSWIDIEDAVAAVAFLLNRSDIHGPVNMTAPNPVTNAEFTRALAGALSRPAVIPVPAFAVRLLLGEMADALLLSSTRAEPGVLSGADFQYSYPSVEASLRHLLKN